MNKEKYPITYKGHEIARENHYKNAYIHFRYIVTGPMFKEPFTDYNLQRCKNEINNRLELEEARILEEYGGNTAQSVR